MKWENKLDKFEGDLKAIGLHDMIARRMWKGLNLGCALKPLTLTILESKLYQYHPETNIPDTQRIANIAAHDMLQCKNVEYMWDTPICLKIKNADQIVELIPDGDLNPWPLFLCQVGTSNKPSILAYAALPKLGLAAVQYLDYRCLLTPPYTILPCSDYFELLVQDVTKFISQLVDTSSLIELLNDD